MLLIVKKEIAQRVGYEKFAPFGASKESWSTYRNTHEIDLSLMSEVQLLELQELLLRYKNVRGIAVLLSDIASWRRVLHEGVTTQRARTVRQFTTLLTQYLRTVPRHHV